jgi:hypothetical protein
MLSDGQATIYGGGEPGAEVFGCVPGHRRIALGRIAQDLVQAEPGVIAELTIAGPMVAFEERASERVAALNLRTGRFVARVSTAGPRPMRALQIVLKNDGAFAWDVAAGFGYTGLPAPLEIRAVDAAGNRRVAYGLSGEIEPTSLARAGSTLYWTQGGAARSATLN